jgi:predicted cobalt transporter CbtA
MRVGARVDAALRLQPAPGAAGSAHVSLDVPLRLPAQRRERAEVAHQRDHRHASALRLPPGACDAAPGGPHG